MEFDDRLDTGADQKPETAQLEDRTAEETSIKQSTLQMWEAALEEKQKKLEQCEADLSNREAILSGCEKELKSREQKLASLEKKLKEQQSTVSDRERSIQNQMEQLKSREEELCKQTNLVNEKATALTKRESETLDYELDISRRENALMEQQVELDRQRLRAKEQLQKEQLEAKVAFEKKLAEERVTAMSDLQTQLETERQTFEATLLKREQIWKKSVQEQMDQLRKTAESESSKILKQAEETAQKKISLLTQEASNQNTQAAIMLQTASKRSQELDEREKNVQEREDALDTEKRKVEREKRRLEARDSEFEEREQDLEAAVQAAIGDKIRAFNDRLKDKDRELADVRDHCRQLEMERESIETFKVSIGETPEIIRNRQDSLQREIDSLRQELSRRAPESLQQNYQELQKDHRQLQAELGDLQEKTRILEQKNRELSHFEAENIILTGQNQELNSAVEALCAQAEEHRKRIKRLSSNEAKLSDYEARVAEIKKGLPLPLVGAGLPNVMSELDWLQNISKQCADYGISFPPRILYAFHTALKISDWSSITVLAGVSGTGKSELPKLYAAFGGLNFIAVPVQPNWDSQESMLGFFNSIDNRFEPEDLLRFLVQCTEDENEYSKYMSIVLLDEMNLAHVEHYFADFLSKLESRRGSAKGDDLPSVEVKLGAGVPPYRLKLSRSVMWTGTMNQDETTKSLSDKVLDRGLVINFPRPRTLRSRESMPILQSRIERSGRPMLTTKTWNAWVVRKINIEGDQRDELERYRKIVERINDELEHVGRALGHRVWQSIEYYMMNYPTVVAERAKLKPGEMSMELRKEMKIAFEDQIVQKIMPKLRGVETRGHTRSSLESIEALLEEEGFESLKDDFEIACEQGYGQFIWSSAKYVEADEAENEDAAPENATEADKNDEQG